MSDRRSPPLWLVVIGLVVIGLAAWRLWAQPGDDEGADASGASSAATSVAPFASVDPRDRRPDLSRAEKAAVSGTIRDESGEAIAGARVCAHPDDDALRGLGAEEPARCTLSAADGHYRLDRLWPSPTEIHASAPRFVPARWQREGEGPRRAQLKLSPGRTSESVDIVLRSGGVPVRGVVRDISGGEIEGAQVSIRHGLTLSQRAIASAPSGEDGQFELWTAPGRITLVAQAEGYAAGRVRAVAPGEFVELFLTPESVLVGRVVHAVSHEPVAEVEVFASLRGRTRSRSARTDERGEFRIAGLEPGSYKPAVVGDELFGEAAERVHLGLGETSEPVEILAHDAYYVAGTVAIAGNREPCPDGRVTLTRERARKRARTDDEGHVELRGVLPGSYRVDVSCEGYVAEASYPELVVGEPVDREALVGLVWEVREGLAMSGEVVDQDGGPVVDARVSVRMVLVGEAAREQVTNDNQRSEDDGSFTIAGLLPGSYEVRAGGASGRPGPVDPVRVELEPGADVNDVRIVMPASGQLRGRVVDEAGEPVPGVTVEADHLGREESPSARTDDAGRFEFEHLRTGSVRVSASASFGRDVMRAPGTSDDDVQGEVVEVVANEIAEVELVIERRAGVIRGRVLDEGGGPVVDAFVDAQRMSERAGADSSRALRAMRWSWGRQPVLTDQDGRFELDGLAEGRYIVRAHRKGGGEALVEDVELGAEVELVIAATGELGGGVRFGAEGPPPERFTVRVRDRAQGVWLGDDFFRTEGRWRITEVPAGSYEVTVECVGGSAIETVELGEGELRDDVDVVLDTSVSVRGRVVDLDSREPLAGFEVTASAAGGTRRRRPSEDKLNVSGSDGRFELSDVPIGRVRFVGRLRGAGSERKYDFAFIVQDIAPEPAVQDIGDISAVARRRGPDEDAGDLGYTITESGVMSDSRERVIEVAMVRPGGPAAAAGLEVGDTIVGVDGHDVVGDPNRYRVLAGVAAGVTIRLSLADGKTVEITAG